MIMSENQYSRYNRHLLLSEIGFEGQCKLINAKVLIVGVGGLGSPAAIYLAASGIGTIGIVEFDKVDISNLQRQIIYNTKSIGISKALMASEKIKDINPDCKVILHEEALCKKNVLHIFGDYDYIIDATDNLATRYLINDACVLLKKTYIYGSIQNFEGQATVLDTVKGLGKDIFIEMNVELYKNYRTNDSIKEDMTSAIINLAIPAELPVEERAWASDPKEFKDALDLFEREKLELIGTYHMHHQNSWKGSCSREIPSKLDAFLAKDTGIFTFIVGISEDGNHSLRAFYESLDEIKISICD